MPALSFRAAIAAQTVDDGERTVELVWTTGAPVQRMDYWTGERYIEVLSLDPAHIRLDRLNDGGPVLDSHSSYSVGDILGAVVPGSVTLTKKEGRAKVRFSRREAVEPIWQDIRDGIVSHVSVGYKTHKVEETKPAKDNALPIRKAIDWEPYEISMVPVPADAGAKVRGEKPADTNPCEILTRAEAPPSTQQIKKEPTRMDPEARSETIVEQPVVPATPSPAPAAEPTERDEARQEERARVQGIMTACRAARLPQSFADGLIADGTRLLDAQTRVFQELMKRGDDDRGPSRTPSGPVIVGDDPLVHVRAGIENAILHRVAPDFFKLDEIGRKYRGMTMLDIGRTYLTARGIRTTDCSKMELASLALGLTSRGGMHSTSDFPILLENVARKTLRAAYEEAEQTFKLIGRRVTLPDFKASNRLQLGDAPALLKVKEHGEFKRGTMTESKEALQLETYGRVFAITRQALINDDTDAFSRVPIAYGRAARTLESDLVWAEITSNPVMGDGVTLFHATHGNLAGAGTVISVTSLGAARAAMRVQKSLDGTTVLNIVPKYLATPAALETLAATFLTQVTPNIPSSVNPFAGLLAPLVEPRLDANSVTAWYLFAGAGVDVIEYAYLEGEEGPAIDTRLGFDIDGMEIKCRLDFDAKVIDWRGVYKNPGA